MRKLITLITTGLVLVLAAIVMAASGEVAPVTTVSVHQIPSAVSIRHTSGDYFVGKVTAANGVAQSGRKVYLYSTYDRVLGTSLTGTYPGHSKGYWQVRVNGWAGISLHHFDAYVTDRFSPWIDYLPAQSPVIPF
jgi:hypothetical protein